MKLKVLTAIIAGTFMFASNPAPTVHAAERDLVGVYTVVTARRAADVAGGSEDLTMDDDAVGRVVLFGESLEWFDGKTCETWTTSEVPDGAVVNLDDPMLSDLQAGETVRRGSIGRVSTEFHGWTITCDGEYLAAIQFIDRYVLVIPSPSGLTNLILERPQSQETIALVQYSLQGHGLYTGELTGEIDAATRRAIAARAFDLGADYEFEAGVLTVELLLDLMQ